MTKQCKPNLKTDTELVGTPVYMELYSVENEIGWAVHIDWDSDTLPEWLDQDMIQRDFYGTGGSHDSGDCKTLAKAQDAALKAAWRTFKRYQKIVDKLGTKLTKQIAKDLAKMEKLKP